MDTPRLNEFPEVTGTGLDMVCWTSRSSLASGDRWYSNQWIIHDWRNYLKPARSEPGRRPCCVCAAKPAGRRCGRLDVR